MIAESTEASATGMLPTVGSVFSATSVRSAGGWFADAGTTAVAVSLFAATSARVTLQSTDFTPSVSRAAAMTLSS